tara:strand:- start:377 stop:484 length:108 start_codon:yes stop_codon:yes gene_type:complete
MLGCRFKVNGILGGGKLVAGDYRHYCAGNQSYGYS